MIRLLLLLALLCFAPVASLMAQDQIKPNPYTYLDQYCDSYYPGTDFPKLTTPQWIGQPGVQAVVTLGIDDMRESAKYETYLRPILDRLKQIDGRSPVSIMACKADPNDPQLQSWIDEGLSIETHTTDHPCPCLQGGNFAKAKSTYDRCVDKMFSIPNNKPVAFRFPCMDSKNTPSPRAFAEIVNKTTAQGNFLQASTSVVCIFNSKDPQLPKSLTLNADGSERFERYIPFPSFVNKVENYPYPYVIGKLCWEFPCTVPDDWQAQNIQKPNNPRTVDDLINAIDATVIKQGIADIVFHPYDWIRNDQMATVVDRVDKKHGGKVKFLTFRECIDRINKNLLLGQPLRAPDGGDNGVRILDLNQDGFLDVLIGNENLKVARIWNPNSNRWVDSSHALQLTDKNENGRVDLGVRIGQLDSTSVDFIVNTESTQAWHQFKDNKLVRRDLPKELSEFPTAINGVDQGVRLRDIDGDGVSEILLGNANSLSILKLAEGRWTKMTSMPFPIIDEQGRDNGMRFVDFNVDGYDDAIVANSNQREVRLYDPANRKFDGAISSAVEIPLIVRDGANNGAWFAADHMWLQNEDTNRMPDGVDRRTFAALIGNEKNDNDPAPQSPIDSLNSIQVRDGFKVELVAAEPMVMDPVALDWGADGKLWVAEMADYPLGIDDKGQPGGRVRYLEDTDGNGTYDKSTLFLDSIAYPTGVIAWRDGVIISAAPTVFFVADRDGDGKAEYREELYRGFTEGNQQHLVNGFERGLDNWLYLANGDSGGTVESVKTKKKIDIRGQDLRIRPDDGSLDAQAGRTQFGRHRDDHGNWFGCSNPLPVRHYVLADQYLRRNPNFAPPSAHRDIATVTNAQLFPISKILSHWSDYKPPAPGTGHQFTSACSTMVYRDDLFGNGFQQCTFTCEPVHNAVHRRRLIPSGVTFDSKRSEDEKGVEFLASSDSWFRPATVTTGPDGAIWVVDMYRLVIEHPEWIDDQREKELFLRAGHDRGRIYRVYPTDNKPREPVALGKLELPELVAQLESPNGRTRDLAQELLVQRNDKSSVALLEQTVRSSQNPMARLHALCTLDGLQQVTTDLLVTVLSDSHATVVRHAVRVSESFLKKKGAQVDRILTAISQCDQSDPHVRLQIAYSLGFNESLLATRCLAKIAIQSRDDPYIRAAVISSLNEQNLVEFYATIAASKSTLQSFQDSLTEMAVRTKEATLVSKIVDHQIDRINLKEPNAERIGLLADVLAKVGDDITGFSPETRTRVIDLADQCESIANDPNAKSDLRVAAVRLVGSLPSNSTKLFQWLDIAQYPVGIQLAAGKILATRNTNQLLRRLSDLTPTVRGELVDEIIKREWTTLKLTAAIENKSVARHIIGSTQQQRIQNHHSEKVKQAAAEIWGPSSQSPDKQELLESYASASPLRGDAQQGLAVFTKHCSACHKAKGVGHEVGPNLAAIKNRSPKAMLTAILDPNAAVEDKYRSYTVLTDDGTVFTGMIANETSTVITIRGQKDETKTIFRSDIQQIKSLGTSVMPEGLEKSVSPTDMSHVLAFLGELGPAPKQFDGNAPATVHPSKTGVIELKATQCRIYGEQIVFEPKYQNIGYWSNPDDHVEWTITVQRPGKYSVWIDYACPDHTSGNQIEFSCGAETLTGKIDGTGTWDDYRQVNLGTIELAGPNQIAALRPVGQLKKNLLDLRSVTLKPQNE